VRVFSPKYRKGGKKEGPILVYDAWGGADIERQTTVPIEERGPTFLAEGGKLS